jgi:hypothetical protein
VEDKPRLEDILPLVPKKWQVEFLNFWVTSHTTNELKEAVRRNARMRRAVKIIALDECKRFGRYCRMLDMTAAEFLEDQKKLKKLKRKERK